MSDPFKEIGRMVYTLRDMVVKELPASRERSLAVTKLEEAIQWLGWASANAEVEGHNADAASK